MGSWLHAICAMPMDTIIEPECPSIAVDNIGNPYIAWDRSDLNSHFYDIIIWAREYGSWTSEVISNTGNCADEEDPYLAFENGVLHCVWSGTEDNGGTPFNIYHTERYPGQVNGGWNEPEEIHYSTTWSSTPVYEKGHAVWSEANKEIVVKRFDYDNFDWQLAPVETTAKAEEAIVRNMNPVSMSSEDRLYTTWSNRDKFGNYYIQYDERDILYIPHYTANLGGEEPSPFTVERDGYFSYGEEFYMTVDYDSTELIYNIQGLEPEPGQNLELMFYHKFNDAIKLRIRIDDGWTRNIWISSGEPISVEGMIPVSCLEDGEINLTIEPVPPTQNALAVCSALWIYDKTGGGGPMSAGKGNTPLIYSLKTPSPSPFNDNTVINYSISKSGKVSLKVYDRAGRSVRTLENGVKDAGVYHIKWNGRNSNQKKVSQGVYFIRLVSGNFTSVKKVVLVR